MHNVLNWIFQLFWVIFCGIFSFLNVVYFVFKCELGIDIFGPEYQIQKCKPVISVNQLARIIQSKCIWGQGRWSDVGVGAMPLQNKLWDWEIVGQYEINKNKQTKTSQCIVHLSSKFAPFWRFFLVGDSWKSKCVLVADPWKSKLMGREILVKDCFYDWLYATSLWFVWMLIYFTLLDMGFSTKRICSRLLPSQFPNLSLMCGIFGKP